MKVKSLKVRVATFLQQRVADYVVDGVDLLLDQINESHREMQTQYDFQYSRVTVDALVDLQNGCQITPLPLHGTTTLVSVKKVLQPWLTDKQGNDRPLKFVDRDWQREDLRERWYGIPTPFAPVQRDVPTYPTFYETYLVQMATTLFLYPSATTVFPQNPVPVFLDVVRFFPDYADDDDNPDFLLQYGSDFLTWDTICRLNVLNKEFVPRQEGNVAPPTDLRDAAWAKLLAWDAQIMVTGSSGLTLD
jgi:hypothetical protein